MIQYLSFIDIVIAPFLFILFYIVAISIKRNNIESASYYKYFIPGLLAKVIGSIALCLVYGIYYSGGDPTCYFHDNVCLSKLFLINPIASIKYTFGEVDQQLYSLFDRDTDWPIFAFDIHAVYVTKITWVLSLLSLNSFVGQSMLLAFFAFFPVWRMYKMFLMEFPSLEKRLAFAILFIPSEVFWGSGLSKDTLTFSAVALFTSSFYYIIKLKQNYLRNGFLLLISSWILINIKPYILFALLPGTIIWLTSYRLEKVNNKLVRFLITPTFIAMAVLMGFVFLKFTANTFREYSVDKVLEKALITQQDLKQDYYHGSSFDIGDFEPTIPGVLSKAPIAIIAALFRPFIWESYNPAMIVSGIENLIILIFTIYLIVRLGIYNFIKLPFKNHLLFFSVSFSLFFAFAVGLSTSNFGSLVRYKIPAIPFFISSPVIFNYYYQQERKLKIKKEQAALNGIEESFA